MSTPYVTKHLQMETRRKLRVERHHAKNERTREKRNAILLYSELGRANTENDTVLNNIFYAVLKKLAVGSIDALDAKSCWRSKFATAASPSFTTLAEIMR